MKVRYIISILSVVLFFSFTACTACNIPKTDTEIKTVETTAAKTTMAETIIPEATQEVPETTIDESKDYIAKIIVIGLKISESLGTFGQSMLDASNGKISISKNKEDTSNYIKDINDCYDIYLSLKVPEKFNTPHELMGKAMDHLTNANIYLQQYIDTENIGDMTDYLRKATSEMNIATEYINKATEQYSNLK